MRLSDQNTPSKHGFFALFRKKRKDGFCNKLNIKELHFCILHFENVEECTLNRVIKKAAEIQRLPYSCLQQIIFRCKTFQRYYSTRLHC